MGHSLGGMLARSIALNLLDSGKISNQDNVKVIMFDSWTLGTDNLKLDIVRSYLKVENTNLNFEILLKQISGSIFYCSGL